MVHYVDDSQGGGTSQTGQMALCNGTSETLAAFRDFEAMAQEQLQVNSQMLSTLRTKADARVASIEARLHNTFVDMQRRLLQAMEQDGPAVKRARDLEPQLKLEKARWAATSEMLRGLLCSQTDAMINQMEAVFIDQVRSAEQRIASHAGLAGLLDTSTSVAFSPHPTGHSAQRSVGEQPSSSGEVRRKYRIVLHDPCDQRLLTPASFEFNEAMHHLRHVCPSMQE